MIIHVVTPWFGVGSGGAERAVEWLVQGLAGRGLSIGVVSTTLGDPHKGFHEAFLQGTARIRIPGGGGLEYGVTRFSPRERDAGSTHSALLERIEAGDALSGTDERAFFESHYSSPGIEEYVRSHPDDLFAFAPYCFGTTVLALPLAERSISIPCLHDESMARLPGVQRCQQQAGAVGFLSEPERNLFVRFYGNPVREAVPGLGISPVRATGSPIRCEPYFLLLGRKHRAKGTLLALDYYSRYRDERGGRVPELVLAGPGELPPEWREIPGISDLGRVTEEEKANLLAHSRALILPSFVESFSIALMEAWSAGVPALVNAACPVTLHHARESNGALWFEDYPTFAGCLDYLLRNRSAARTLGSQGRQYVMERFAEERVLDRWQEFFREVVSG